MFGICKPKLRKFLSIAEKYSDLFFGIENFFCHSASHRYFSMRIMGTTVANGTTYCCLTNEGSVKFCPKIVIGVDIMFPIV